MINKIKNYNFIKLIQLCNKYGIDNDLATTAIKDCKVFNVIYIELSYILFLVVSLFLNIDIVSSMPICLFIIIFCAVYKVRQLLSYTVLMYEKKYNNKH